VRIGTLLIAASLLGITTASSEQPSGSPLPSVSGYGLFRSTSQGWTWDPVSTTTPIAAIRSTQDGCGLAFSIPQAALKGMAPEKIRIGLVSGGLGTQPTAWISTGRPYALGADIGSPWESRLVGQAQLKTARVSLADGQVRVEIAFDVPPELRSPWDLYLLIDADGNTQTGFLGGDYLIQDTTLNAEKDKAPALSLPWFEIRPGLFSTGQGAEVTAWVQNGNDKALQGVTTRLDLPHGLTIVAGPSGHTMDLRPKEARRVTWRIRGEAPGKGLLRIEAAAERLRARRVQWVSVVARQDARHEYQTAAGAWLPFPPRPTLQDGNREPLDNFETLPSVSLKRNGFGITAHLPRSTNDEDPFVPAHAIDGSPDTCWASRWWRTPVPFTPEWIEVDWGSPRVISEIRFLFAWQNRGAPAAFTVEVSEDGRTWTPVADPTDYALKDAPEGSPLHRGTMSWQCFPLPPRPARAARLTATRLNRAPGFFCCPFDPYQVRVSEVAVLDSAGKPLDLARKAVRASSVNTAWYNTPEVVTRTWPLLLKSGVKLNRIGQWGDKTDWAAVERTRGTFHIDPEVDRAITESVNGGVDIILTLAYGNNLYQKLRDPGDFGPTWHRGHPFLQCAPTTPEAVEAFARYCAFMATHFRGRVKYFEIWNEQNGWFFDAWADNGKVSMVRAYGRALGAAAKAIRQANPEAVVVFGGMAGSSLDFPRIALQEGNGRLIDVIAFHPYGHPTPEAAPAHFLTEVDGKMDWRPRPAGIANYEDEIAAYRSLLRPSNPRIQIWADEMNWFAPGEPAMSECGDQSELTQAKHLARFFAINAWLECAAVWWSLVNTNGIQEWAVLRSDDLSPRPAWYSTTYVSTALDDVRPEPAVKAEVVGTAPPDLTVRVYRNGAGRLLVGLWRTGPGNDACRPVPITLRLSGAPGTTADLVDTLYGYRQRASMRRTGTTAETPNLLVGDWPLIVLFTGDKQEPH
jgi:hypothetical protein